MQPSYRFNIDPQEAQQQKIEILELTEEKCKFVLTDIDLSYANALRRVMMAEVPTMAIHFVDIIENTSPLQDEFLSQRLGLIPLVSYQADSKYFDWEVDADSMDDQKTKAVFTIKQKNLQDVPMDVTSLHLEPEFGQVGEFAIRPVKMFSPIDGREVGVPITRLGKNQSIHVRCHALKGFGKMHAKWSPVSISSFRQEADLLIDNQSQLSLTEKEEIIRSCPVNVLGLDAKTGELKAINSQACIFCEECCRTAESFKKPRIIKIQQKKNKFIFTVESTGQLKASEIVQRAMQVLNKKLSDIQQALEWTAQGLKTTSY